MPTDSIQGFPVSVHEIQSGAVGDGVIIVGINDGDIVGKTDNDGTNDTDGDVDGNDDTDGTNDGEDEMDGTNDVDGTSVGDVVVGKSDKDGNGVVGASEGVIIVPETQHSSPR